MYVVCIFQWVKDAEESGSPKHTSTPIKVENPNQFAPQGTNPKEYREKQKKVNSDQVMSSCNNYTMVCLPVGGDNLRALASGLSPVQVDKPWYNYSTEMHITLIK